MIIKNISWPCYLCWHLAVLSDTILAGYPANLYSIQVTVKYSNYGPAHLCTRCVYKLLIWMSLIYQMGKKRKYQTPEIAAL